jgi:hypothetical protein
MSMMLGNGAIYFISAKIGRNAPFGTVCEGIRGHGFIGEGRSPS